METALGTVSDIRELKVEITELRNELKRFVEKANQQHVESVLGALQMNYAGLFTDLQIDEANVGLSGQMHADCAMRDTCFALFLKFLQNTAHHIKEGQVSEERIRSYRNQMKAMRKKGRYDTCDTCFSEVDRLFEKQVDLMQSLGIYQKNDSGTSEILADDSVVKDILEPVANIQRFQILKFLTVQTRTFSDISQMTGLRGGNLLFHIKKLTESGMILQRHERGDYIITGKGYKTMTAISQLRLILDPS